MDEAMSDLCALKLLEQMTGKETAYRCLEVQEGEELNFEKYPRRISYLAGMREKVNDEIRKRTINEQISNFAQTYPTSLKVSSNEALLFMRRYRFANCSCFSCCFKDAYPSSNVQ